MSVQKLYQEYVNKYGERFSLFELIINKFQIRSAIYPGCALHITPSFFFPITVYIDTYSKAKQFFRKENLQDFIINNKRYEETPVIRFYPSDYTKKVDEKDESFDLLISQYAGFISKHCKKYLKIGRILLVNNSHGDASLASIDKDYEFIAVINLRTQKYHYSDRNLEQYFIPKKEMLVTEDLLEKRQRGIGYKKTASLYLFKRIN
jgi:hypothetical protein